LERPKVDFGNKPRRISCLRSPYFSLVTETSSRDVEAHAKQAEASVTSVAGESCAQRISQYATAHATAVI
jgi:hypothetical protein